MQTLQLDTANTRELHINPISLGIVPSDTVKKDVGLKDCLNLIYEDGYLKTRAGLYAASENILDNESFARGEGYSYCATNVSVNIDGDNKPIALEKIYYDRATYVCLFHIISSNGEYFKSIPLIFTRISDEAFYIPKKINIFKGKPQNGAGIYCIVNSYNTENSAQQYSKIYELNSEFTEWLYTQTSYTPTVLMNGRGNKYETAKQTGQVFTGTPTRLEGLNILNGEFHAYYSTDGFSSSFRLPFARLSNKRIICRLYYTVTDYVEWLIGENQSSAKARLYSTDVTMNVNREKGIVYFSVPAGEYSMPLFSDRNENNLKITAVKDCEYCLDDIADSDCAIGVNGKILLGSKNKIFVSDNNNPLYFPLQSITSVGQADEMLTSLVALKNSIFAFKSNEIYSINVNDGKTLNTTSLLADSDTVFYSGDSITSKCISNKNGCRNKGMVSADSDRIYWYDSDENIYSLSDSGKIQCAAHNKSILSRLSSSNVIAAALNDGCLFLDLYRAVVIKYNDSQVPAVYYWEFPRDIEICGSFYINGNTLLLCKSIYSEFSYIACFNGINDCYISGKIYSPEYESFPVSSAFVTQETTLYCDNTLKNINLLALRLKGETALVVLNRKLKFRVKDLNSETFKTVKITPYLCGVDRFSISLSADRPIEIGSMDIKYSILKF